MDLDPAILIPALFFTAVAIYCASSYLSKKAEAPVKNKPKVGYGDEIPPSRALAVARPKVEVPPPVVKEVKPVPEEEPVAVAPVVEEIRVVEEQPIREPEIIAVKEPEVQHVPEPVAVPEPEPEPVVVPEPEPEPVAEPEPVPEPEEEPVPEPEPEEEALPELIPGPIEEVYVSELVEDDFPDAEADSRLDEGAAEDDLSPRFTPGKKISKFETLMTKEEMEEEQRAAE